MSTVVGKGNLRSMIQLLNSGDMVAILDGDLHALDMPSVDSNLRWYTVGTQQGTIDFPMSQIESPEYDEINAQWIVRDAEDTPYTFEFFEKVDEREQ